MKRRNYDIDGDTITNGEETTTTRYTVMMYWGDGQPSLSSSSLPLSSSFFSWLPEEVIGLIASHILTSDAQDLQAFLRYLLPMFGISLTTLRTTYTQSQQEILTMMQQVLTTNTQLFKECLRERLLRISDCIYPRADKMTENLEQLNAVKLISTIPYLELFSFTYSRVCECCKESFALNRSIPVDIALCLDCGRRLNYNDRIRYNRTTLSLFVNCDAKRLYSWMSEKLVRLWLGLSNDNACLPPHFRSHIMGKKATTFYLLKDVMPFIDEQFLLNPPPKPSCIRIR